MTIDWESLASLEVALYTGTLPPPYRHQIHTRLQKGEAGWKVTFTIEYLDRDEVSEEEILEEGFTLEDDFEWEGPLPEAWAQHFAEAMKVTTFPHDQPKATLLEPQIQIAWRTGIADAQAKVPAETGYWEYLLQELMQAIYELAGLERPLEVSWRQVPKNPPAQQISLEAQFAQRSATLKVMEDEQTVATQLIPWEEVKECMRHIYQYEFDVLRAKPKLPQKRGTYLYLGEGGWLPIPEALISNTKDAPNGEAISDWFLQWAKA